MKKAEYLAFGVKLQELNALESEKTDLETLKTSLETYDITRIDFSLQSNKKDTLVSRLNVTNGIKDDLIISVAAEITVVDGLIVTKKAELLALTAATSGEDVDL